ncbi:IS6 family transposase [Streptomyces sp. TE5632]
MEIIAHCVWRCFRFPLGFREVEELMLQRGLLVSHETICRRRAQSGRPAPPTAPARGHVAPRRALHQDQRRAEVPGRAVDADGTVLDILVQGRRDEAAARRFFRRLLKTTRSVPQVIVTDRLRSHSPTHREVMPSVEHRCHKGLNNRAENSHQPTRRRERAMKGFPQRRRGTAVPGRVRRCLTPLRPRRHLMSAHGYRVEVIIRFAIRDQVISVAGRPAAA